MIDKIQQPHNPSQDVLTSKPHISLWRWMFVFILIRSSSRWCLRLSVGSQSLEKDSEPQFSQS